MYTYKSLFLHMMKVIHRYLPARQKNHTHKLRVGSFKTGENWWEIFFFFKTSSGIDDAILQETIDNIS